MRAKDYIKKISNVPNKFVDEIFSFYDENTLQTDFVIDLNHVAKWLDTRKSKLMETLRNTYKKNIDYIITKDKNPYQKDPRNNNYKHVLITPDCFKRICMLTRSSKGETVRSYFIDIENTFIKYRQQTLDGIKLDMKPRRKYPPSTGYVYIIRVSEQKNLYKIGSTKDMNKRSSTYRTGRERDIDLMFLYKTDNIQEVEGCMKSWLKPAQYINKTEIYQIDFSEIKKLVHECAKIGMKLHYKSKVTDKTDNEGTKYFVTYKKEEQDS